MFPKWLLRAMARYVLKKLPDGAEQIRDDIHEALSCGDKDHASELLMVLRHFLETHPEAQMKRAEAAESNGPPLTTSAGIGHENRTREVTHSGARVAHGCWEKRGARSAGLGSA
jgi:hypothetical protein